ncbi:hypothetical protein LEMLEM_LOCUS27100 [Lemmus lemmus]
MARTPLPAASPTSPSRCLVPMSRSTSTPAASVPTPQSCESQPYGSPLGYRSPDHPTPAML